MHHLVTARQRDWIKEAVAKVGVHLTVTRRGTASAVLAALLWQGLVGKEKWV